MVLGKLSRDSIPKSHPLTEKCQLPTSDAHVAAALKAWSFILSSTEHPIIKPALQLINKVLGRGEYNISVEVVLIVKHQKYSGTRPGIRASRFLR